MRTWMRINLVQAGFQVDDLDPVSLEGTLESLRILRPRMLVTDYEMPAYSGETLIRALREDPLLRDLQVAVVTSHRDEELVSRLMDLDIAAYLLKPLSPESMVEALRPLLEA